ncbi:putative portal protein [Tsukamurella phage TPA4]|uniref:putative portal protein n=1 Tax=Tsukamurella phage TPA4 TaxID=1647476 RepID=UPI0007B62F26|nr:putative portal protein [Tsukamurella phage TPA4]AKJ72168.1 putative portal protein [Tsukamurella phage TPA4]
MTRATPDSPITALALPALSLNDTEESAAAQLRARLTKVKTKNDEKSSLYEGKRTAEDLGIAAPEGLPELIRAVSGWPGTVVDVLDERLDFRGWTGAEKVGLNDIVRDNHLDAESGRGHVDALIYGCGFITAGRGDAAAGEPEVLVTVESTESCTVEWDYRLRRAKSGLSQTRDENGNVILETLYLPDKTIGFEAKPGGRLEVVRRDEHGLGRVPVARMLNRDRASDLFGRSEITREIAYLTDACIRALVGMEINREFYTSPKWSALDTDPEVFGMGEDKSARENRKAAWTATAGYINAVPPQFDEQGTLIPTRLHEFRPSAPTPYIDLVRAYSQLLAAAAGMPSTYLGFVTDNPTSADSIRQQEYRLVKRAERRQTSFGMAWMEIAYLALLLRDHAVDRDVFRGIGVNWRDASTPTRAAAADEAMKLVSAGILLPDSSITYDRVGLSLRDQEQLAKEKRTASIGSLVGSLTGEPAAPSAPPADAVAQASAEATDRA